MKLTEDSYDDYDGVEFDVTDMSTWPALVIATSIPAGMEYAKVLGLRNFSVRTTMEKIQGMRIRSVVVTPGYLSKVEMEMLEARRAYEAAIRSLSLSSSTMG